MIKRILTGLIVSSAFTLLAHANQEAKPHRDSLRSHSRALVQEAKHSGGAASTLSSFTARASGKDHSDWPKAWVRFMEPLTYPSSEWNPEDFGRETSEEDRELLHQYQPRIFIGPKNIPPVDFYRDYLPQTIVYGPKGKVVREKPTRSYLKSIERSAGFYLKFIGNYSPCRGSGCIGHNAKIYGRSYRELIRTTPGMNPQDSKKIVILKYNLAFAVSGLPINISWYKELAARIIGEAESWHQLDIHGAIHLLMVPGAKHPFAVLLAQHNHFRTYLVGKDLDWPENNRLCVCYSERSNEPYLCPDGKVPAKHRAIGNIRDLRFLVLGKHGSLTTGRDLVYGKEAGATEVHCDLEFLTSRDPLYVSWIPLGDKKSFLGFGSFYLQGPPGINMNTSPKLKKYGDIAQFFYFEDGDQNVAKLFKRTIKGFSKADFEPALRYNGARFWDHWKNIGRD